MANGFIDQADVDLVVNGRVEGSMADSPSGETLSKLNYDPGILRPVIMPDGQKGCVLRTGKMLVNERGEPEHETEFIPLQRLINAGLCPPTYNAASLPYQTWYRIDTAVLKASRARLGAWNDLVAANPYTGFDAMGTTALIRDTMTDPGEAKVDLDTLSDDFNDQPIFQPDIVPLPIIHAGFMLSQRRLAQSRNGGQPLDTSGAEACGRRCAETLENMTIGMTNFSGLTAGAAATFTNRGIYGFRTQPDRMTFLTVNPVATFLPSTFLTDILAMKELARAQNFHGPFILYYSTTWDQYLGRDYYFQATAAGLSTPTQTVLQRVQQIAGISAFRGLDYFTSASELLLVQMNSDTVRAIDGMDWTTVQWVEQGGARLMFRVMGIKVPDLRSQFINQSVVVANRVCGIVHGTPP